MVAAANAGAQLVLGTVRPNSELPRALRASWQREHPQREDHPHVHGANLGIRADSYEAIGGWADVAAHEDVDLAVRAATAPNLPIRRTATIPVLTSARFGGRAPEGFASYLRHLQQSHSGRTAVSADQRSPRVAERARND
jgi:hypothetical protein